MPQGQLSATLLFFLCAAADQYDPTADDPSERAALASFYTATGGSSWINSSGWLQSDISYCTWAHVSCHPRVDGKLNSVAGINIKSNNLTGFIPDLSRFRQLASFGVLLNHFDAPAPLPDDWWGLSPTLSGLWLCLNQWTGGIPRTLTAARFPHLRFFGCKHCNLTGVVPDGIATLQLDGVFLEANNLTSMPVDWAPPSCTGVVIKNNATHGDCCNVGANPWRCPVAPWALGDVMCNANATCT